MRKIQALSVISITTNITCTSAVATNSTPHFWGCYLLYNMWKLHREKQSNKQKAYSVIEIRLEGNAILICDPFCFYVPKQDYNIQNSVIFVVASHGRIKGVLIIIVLT